MLTIALQGHTYRHTITGRKLMAMSTGAEVDAYEVNHALPWPLTTRMCGVPAEHLEPLPMTYFGGQVPQVIAGR